MATMFSADLVPDTYVAANIQGWASWIESVLTTIAGWTVTSDTGQTLPSALPAGTAQNQRLGYRVYEMHDEFTDDQPIFMRIDFGTGMTSGTPPSSIGYTPGINFSFGAGTDGAGNLTGIYWNGQGWHPSSLHTVYTNSHPSQPPITFRTRSYARADNSSFILGLFILEGNNPAGFFGSEQITFSLERSRDRDGIYTGDGLLISYTDNQILGGGGTVMALNATKYLILDRPGRAQPPLEKGLSYPYIRHTPAYSYDGTIPCALCSHFRGTAQQPGINFIMMGANDISAEGQYQVVQYGQTRIYQNLRYLMTGRAAAGPVGSAGPLNDAGCRISMLYD